MSDIRMGGSSVYTSTLGIKFADGTTQITASFGTWVSGMPYIAGNTVYFGGSYWAALLPSTGSIPSTSNPDWARFMPSGLWNPLSSYAIDSEVTYLGVNYIAISPSGPTAITPDLNTTAWTLIGGNATEIQGVPVSPILPDHNGELLIYDSVSNSYVPGDPLVQGLFPEGTATSGINPILVSGKGADGLQHSLSVDNSGVLNVNATFPSSIAVTGTFWQATQPVSGTFWQATQPVSGTVAVSSVSGSVAVTGTFWQATQPISGAISFTAPQHVIIDSATLGTVAVSGTFWQATQPVSGTFFQATQPVSIATMPTTPVTGTFWQATQPISGAISFTAPQHVIIDSGSLGTVTVSGTVATTQSGTWTVGISAAQTIAVTGTFWQATQPVSSTQLPAALDGSGFLKVHEQGTVPVTGTFWQTTQPVSGTFWQTTQPISGAVSFTAPQHVIVDSATLGTVAVSGTFWQATQPVSIASMPSTPVTGTFWQATQPVSGAFYQTTQPVSGTFWQATQPISGAISFTAPQHVITDSGSVTNATLSAETTKVIGAVNQGTSPWVVSGTVAFSNSTIAVTNAGTFAVQAAQSGAWNIGTVTTVSAVTAITNALPAGTNTIGKVDILGNAGATLDAAITAGAAPTNALASLVVYNATPPVLTTGQSVAQQGDTTGSTYVNTEGRKATYRMAAKAFIPVASASSPTFSIQGSATKVIRITKIHISWSCSIGNTLENDIWLQRFSALTGGTTGSTPTGALNDTANAAQTAVCLQYSAVPTVATTVGGFLAAERIAWVTPAVNIYPPDDDIDWVFGNDNGQTLVLRGTAQYVGIVVAVAAGTSGLPLMTLYVEWTEE